MSPAAQVIMKRFCLYVSTCGYDMPPAAQVIMKRFCLDVSTCGYDMPPAAQVRIDERIRYFRLAQKGN